MALELKALKKKEPIIERLNIPVPASLNRRYRELQHNFSERGYNLHDIIRERLLDILDEAEGALAKTP